MGLNSRGSGRKRGAEAGLSMIEVLFATLIFFLVIMGLLPLFTRSAINNAMGATMTQLANQSKSQTEGLYQASFNSAPMTIPAGATEVVTQEFWDVASGTFIATPPADGSTARYTRTTTIRQYGLSDLNDNRLDNPLPGDTDATAVQLKEIEVGIVSNDIGPIRGRQILVRTLKPF